MSFARWRHFITARDWGYQRAVLSLEQGFTILLFMGLVDKLALNM